MPDLADRPMFGLGEAVEESRRSPRIGIAVAAVVIAAFVAGIWYVYDRGVRRGDLKALPVITADGGPVKSSPADAGGLKVPHVDGEMPRAAAGRGGKVEDILPPPERPLAERAAPIEPPKPLVADPPKAEAPSAPPPVAAVEVAPRPAPSPPPAAVAKAAPVEPVEKAAPPASPAQASPALASPAQPSPAPAASEKAPPAIAAVAPAAGRAGAYRIQLVSVGDKKAAENEWRRLARTNGDVLGKLSPSVVTVDLPGKGIFHRLSAGPFADRGAAAEACETLHKRKVGCLVVAP